MHHCNAMLLQPSGPCRDSKFMKKVLKKLGKTDIGMLLREYGAI